MDMLQIRVQRELKDQQGGQVQLVLQAKMAQQQILELLDLEVQQVAQGQQGPKV
jgi:hypothetical protein